MPIAFREQSSPEFALDALSAPWLHLDATEADVSLCRGSLLSVSCFRAGDREVRLHRLVSGPAMATTEIVTYPAFPESAREAVLGLLRVAEPLIAHLYQALTEQRCVVVAAQIQDFAEGAPLAALIEFCRASLPAEIRGLCGARVFAREFAPLLEAGANLFAIPRDAVAPFLGLRSNAVVLDSTGASSRGEEPEEAAARYARLACRCFVENTACWTAWLGKVSYLLPDIALPDSVQLRAAEAICSWLLAETTLEIDPAWSAIDLPWGDIVGEALQGLPARELMEITFGPAGTPGWNGLRRSAASLCSLEPDILAVSSSGWDDMMVRDPAMAIDLLLAIGKWEAWQSQTTCGQTIRREAALAWLGSPYWLDHEPLLEDWVVCVRDLGEALSDADVQRVAALSPRPGVFPPIEWFEQRQHDDMRRLRQARVPVVVETPPDRQGIRGEGVAEKLEQPAIAREISEPDTARAAEIAPGTAVLVSESSPELLPPVVLASDPYDFATPPSVPAAPPPVAALAQTPNQPAVDSRRILWKWVLALLAAFLIGVLVGNQWTHP